MQLKRLMFFKPSMIGIVGFLSLSGCYNFLADTRFDHGLDRKPLGELQAQIWTDPEGCDHWIIDDGLEGYMSPRVSPDGTPICRAGAKPETIYNVYK
jgi:hypothetical protein